MGLSETEFWKLTLEHYQALVKQFEARERRQDYRIAAIIASMGNLFRKPGQPRLTPEKLLRGHRRRAQTPEEIHQFAKELIELQKTHGVV